MPPLSNDFGTLRANQYQVKDFLYNKIEINTTGATSSEVGTVYPYGEPEFPRFLVGFVLLDL
jgi:hypothetical protein